MSRLTFRIALEFESEGDAREYMHGLQSMDESGATRTLIQMLTPEMRNTPIKIGTVSQDMHADVNHRGFSEILIDLHGAERVEGKQEIQKAPKKGIWANVQEQMSSIDPDLIKKMQSTDMQDAMAMAMRNKLTHGANSPHFHINGLPDFDPAIHFPEGAQGNYRGEVCMMLNGRPEPMHDLEIMGNGRTIMRKSDGRVFNLDNRQNLSNHSNHFFVGVVTGGESEFKGRQREFEHVALSNIKNNNPRRPEITLQYVDEKNLNQFVSFDYVILSEGIRHSPYGEAMRKAIEHMGRGHTKIIQL